MLRTLVILLTVLAASSIGASANAAERLALLVGCSEYVHYPQRPLRGAANDVASLRKLLTEDFGFTDETITTLVGWPDEPTARPSYSNICQAFESLIDRAEAGDHVVVYLSGHGCFRKLDAPDATEPDGYDEAFVPADQRKNGDVILDNQVGRWLEQLQDKSAHVWIIFDSCFSGTMTRGDDAAVISKGLEPAPSRSLPADGSFDGLDLRSTSRGSLVAFYAAQESEEAVEVIRPIGADERDVKNRHGLLSYHLEQSLRQRNESLSYRTLSRIITSGYLADGRRRPTPYFEGDLDREVLGLKEWPQTKPLFLERNGGGIRLTAGEFAGIVEGTVLGVYHPDDKDGERPQGYIRATKATATSATVEPIAFAELDAADPAKFPENAYCRIASQDLGDHRVKLAAVQPTGQGAAELNEKLNGVLHSLLTDQLSTMTEARDVSSADWGLVAATPAMAAEWFNLQVKEPTLLLVPREVALLLSDEQPRPSAMPHGKLADPYAAHYSLSEIQQSTLPLARDLNKMFTWQNVWRVAGAYGEGTQLGGRSRIKLEITTSRGKSPARLVAGDPVKVNIVNTSYQGHWYTVLYLNERFGIDVIQSGSIARRPSTGPHLKHFVCDFNVSPELKDTNGFVVIAVSRKDHPHEPDYQFLGQSILGRPQTRQLPKVSRLSTPFEKLLLGVVAGGSSFRSSVSPDKPQVASWSWVTVSPETP